MCLVLGFEFEGSGFVLSPALQVWHSTDPADLERYLEMLVACRGAFFKSGFDALTVSAEESRRNAVLTVRL